MNPLNNQKELLGGFPEPPGAPYVLPKALTFTFTHRSLLPAARMLSMLTFSAYLCQNVSTGATYPLPSGEGC
jgi:hypothetical protein